MSLRRAGGDFPSVFANCLARKNPNNQKTWAPSETSERAHRTGAVNRPRQGAQAADPTGP
jgi:hypothetical protein